MKLQKFVVLLIVLMMFCGVMVYTLMDSDVFGPEEPINVNEIQNTVQVTW